MGGETGKTAVRGMHSGNCSPRARPGRAAPADGNSNSHHAVRGEAASGVFLSFYISPPQFYPRRPWIPAPLADSTWPPLRRAGKGGERSTKGAAVTGSLLGRTASQGASPPLQCIPGLSVSTSRFLPWPPFSFRRPPEQANAGSPAACQAAPARRPTY